MSQLRRLIREIHRRSLWQVLGIYVVGGWIVLQAADTLAGALNLPDWAPSLALFLLIIGVPIVLATAFFQGGGEVAYESRNQDRLPEDVGPSTEESTDAQGGHSWRDRLTWRNALVGGVGAFALWGAVSAAWLLLAGQAQRESSSASSLSEVSPNVVAVIPFSVQGSEDFAYLGRGFVNLLSTKLDGAGELRTVDPSGLLAVAEREQVPAGDPIAARDLAVQFGAGFFVTGDIVEVQGRLQVNAGLYRSGESVDRAGEGTAEGRADQVFAVVDELASELLRSMEGGPFARVQQIAAVTTENLAAYKAFLEGESLARRAQFGAGVQAFQEAVQLDSLFALAHYRLSLAAEWNLQDSLAAHAAEIAVRHAGRLSERDRRLLETFLIRRRGANAEAEQRYRSILGTYPDDMDAWLDLVEILFHAYPLRGRSFTESREPLERVLFYQPQHSTSLIHLSRIAAFERSLAELDSLADKFIALDPSAERSLEIRSLQAFGKEDDSEMAAMISELEQSPNDLSVALSVWSVSVFSRHLEGAQRIATLLAAPTRSREARILGHAWLAHLQLAGGRWEGAKAELANLEAIDPGIALEYRALLSALLASPGLALVDTGALVALREDLTALDPNAITTTANPSVVFTANDRLHPVFRSYLLGLMSSYSGDPDAAREFATEIEGIPAPETAGSLTADLARSVRSAVHRQAGRPEEALAELESSRMETWYGQTMASPLLGQVLERFWRAELLRELGREREALDWYAHLVETSPFETPYLALAHVRQAEIYDGLGDPESAIQHYEVFLRLWAEADPEFQPRVRAAQARLEEILRERG